MLPVGEHERHKIECVIVLPIWGSRDICFIFSPHSLFFFKFQGLEKLIHRTAANLQEGVGNSSTPLVKQTVSLLIRARVSSWQEKSMASNKRVRKGFLLWHFMMELWCQWHKARSLPNGLSLLVFIPRLSKASSPSLGFLGFCGLLERRWPVPWRPLWPSWGAGGLSASKPWLSIPWWSGKVRGSCLLQ